MGVYINIYYLKSKFKVGVGLFHEKYCVGSVNCNNDEELAAEKIKTVKKMSGFVPMLTNRDVSEGYRNGYFPFIEYEEGEKVEDLIEELNK